MRGALRSAARQGLRRLSEQSNAGNITVRAFASEASSGSSSKATTWLLLAAGLGGGAYYANQQGLFSSSGTDILGSGSSTSSKKAAAPDYQAVRDAVADVLDVENYDDGSYGPVLIRLAWHSAGSYDKASNTGGSNGATMRFQPECDYGANAGLKIARDLLEPIKNKFPWISYADLYTLAGCVAVEEMGGPVVNWRPGRSDETSGEACQQDGRLPDAAQGAKHIRDIFYRMGFDDREIVALSGAHTLGRCHTDRSGFKGPWTFSPTTFSNLYFKELLEKKWTKKKWAGPLQYEDDTKELMMLPTDMALIWDKKFKPYVLEYAKDEEKFASDFSAAFQKLLELGVPFDAPGTPAPASPQPKA